MTRRWLAMLLLSCGVLIAHGCSPWEYEAALRPFHRQQTPLALATNVHGCPIYLEPRADGAYVICGRGRNFVRLCPYSALAQGKAKGDKNLGPFTLYALDLVCFNHPASS